LGPGVGGHLLLLIHPVWAYAHVSNGYIGDATAAIVAQMERFAPGFRDRVISQTVSTTTQFAAHKPNFVGGDIHRARIFASWYSARESRCRRTALVYRVCISARPPRRPGPAHTVCAAPTPDKLRDLGTRGQAL